MIDYIPLNYDQLNLVQGGYTPSCIKGRNNKAFSFWCRSLFQRACSVIDFQLPDEWQGDIKDFFYYIMIKFGYCAVWDDPELGKVFNPCGLSGFDFYYRPTRCIIANPALKASIDRTIGDNMEVLKISPDYAGIWDVISYYAEKMALLDNAINISLINNKYSFMLAAKNKAAGEALKKMLDKINQGDPAVIFDRKLADDPASKSEPWQFWNRGNLKESYLTTDQLRDFRTILNDFDNEIGIPTIPVEKKERMITDEANSRKADTMSRCRLWVETFNSSAKAVNDAFGLNLKATLNYEERSAEDGNAVNTDRTV